MTEDEMVGWHHQVNGYEFEQTPRDGEEQGSLVCCSPWGHKKFDPETPPSSRGKGLRFLHGLENNPEPSLQNEEEA